MVNKRAKKRKVRRREYDPAWLYLVLGIICLGGALFYAMYGDHTTRFVESTRGRSIRGPFEIYLATIGGGVGLIYWGIRKLLGPKNNSEPD